MITEASARHLVRSALNHARKLGVRMEALLEAEKIQTIRFGGQASCPTTHATFDYMDLKVSVSRGLRASEGSTDKLTVRSACELVDRVAEEVRAKPIDRRMLRLLSPKSPLVVPNPRAKSCYDPRIARLTAEDRHAAIMAMIEVGRRDGLEVAGVYSPSEQLFLYANSTGLERFWRGTSLTCSVTMQDDRSSGWLKRKSWTLADIDPVAMAEIAARRAIDSRQRVAITPGYYTVVLEPEAVVDLIGDLLFSECAGGTWEEGTSSFSAYLGRRLFPENITISENLYHPLQFGKTFDGEGATAQRTKLIHKGVVKGFLKCRRSVQSFGGHATGSGSGFPACDNDWGRNMVIDGGPYSVQQMIAGTKYGVWIPRFWYDGDLTHDDTTANTRDGARLIVDGKLGPGVNDMRFVAGVIEAFKRVTMLGPSVAAIGEEGGLMVVPPMTIGKFLLI